MTIEELKARVEAEGCVDLGKLPVELRRLQQVLWVLIIRHFGLPSRESVSDADLSLESRETNPLAGHLVVWPCLPIRPAPEGEESNDH